MTAFTKYIIPFLKLSDIDTTIINILLARYSISVLQTLPCIGYQMNIDNQSANLSNEDYSCCNDSLYYPNFNEPFFLLDTGFYTISTIASNQFGCTIDTVILIQFLFMIPQHYPNHQSLDQLLSKIVRSYLNGMELHIHLIH